ncbi:MAG: diacylglycerol/lipid kinase family protein [Burkholderiales bacterium]
MAILQDSAAGGKPLEEPLPVIINAASGKGHTQDALAPVEQAFGDAGARTRIITFGPGDSPRELAERALGTHPPVLVAAGGDGTISAVASVVVGTETALGVLPYGTLNHFAKDLSIPLDLQEAARVIVGGRVGKVDVGEVNGRIFLNNASLGLYPLIARERNLQQRRLGRGKWPALFWATMTVLRRSPFLNVRISLDEQVETRRSTFVFIGNNEYVMEGFNIGSRERLDGGRLSIYVSHRSGRWGLLALAARALVGKLHQAEDFDAMTARSIVIESRRPFLHLALDGEVSLVPTPLQYTIRPAALRVMLPAPAAG